METKKIDLKQVLGLVAEYNSEQKLVSPDQPFEVRATFFRGAASNIHKHPFQEEYYKIHSGEIELYLNGKWIPLKAGEEAFIPRNSTHGFRNTSSQPADLTNIHTPGLSFGASLVAMESLIREGKIDANVGRERNHVVLLFDYSDEMLDNNSRIRSGKPIKSKAHVAE